jgi:DNA-binding NtrC family response regulator
VSAQGVQILLFDEDAALAQALARRLASDSVSITVASSIEQLRGRLANGATQGLILCAEATDTVSLVLAQLSSFTFAPGLATEVFKAEQRTPLWEIQTWLENLVDAQTKRQASRGLDVLIGNTTSMCDLRARVERIAPFTEMSVLITGETGTGKELVAMAVHQLSCPREPFVSVNCAAIPQALFEAELFGHAKGAFTDAEARRTGLLEQAGAGTLFLDEVGELPEEVQPKLLRVLETRRYRRVGEQREQILGARIVSATHQPMLESGQRFRQDLYFRLAGYTIHCPALRERREDIVHLAQYFLRRFCSVHGLAELRLTPAAVALLEAHSFPGNVRELRGVIETAAVGALGAEIDRAELEALLRPGVPSAVPQAFTARRPPFPERPLLAHQLVGPGRTFVSLEELEREVILGACVECRGSVSRAAEQLGIARSTLRDKLRRYRRQTDGRDDVDSR